MCPKYGREEMRKGGSGLHATAAEECRLSPAGHCLHRLWIGEPRMPQIATTSGNATPRLEIRFCVVPSFRGLPRKLIAS